MPIQKLLQVSFSDADAKAAMVAVVPSMISGFNVNTLYGDMAVTGDDAKAVMEVLTARLQARLAKKSGKAVKTIDQSEPAFKFVDPFDGPLKGVLTLHQIRNDTFIRITSPNAKSARWGMLGGTVLLEAKDTNLPDTETHSIRIQFHRAKNLWSLEDEHVSGFRTYPRYDAFGDLPAMMREFEKRTRLTAPTVRVQQVGIGIFDVSSSGSQMLQGNPWKLIPDTTYEFSPNSHDLSAPRTVRFLVSEDQAKGGLHFAILNEFNEVTGPTMPFNQETSFGSEELFSLKPYIPAPKLESPPAPSQPGRRNRP